ncbi:hypothetical protein J4221_05325 [Candidatus Pacearchaeota archaeon]|nr:hypothetical protein [Candidatus Pacearchaeota archaeon]
MIIEKTPLTMNDVARILKDLPNSEKKQEMELFLKKFIKASPSQEKKIKEDLEKLDLIKLKREYSIKTLDLLPEDFSDINKIFTDVSLNEDETNKILGIIKNSK